MIVTNYLIINGLLGIAVTYNAVAQDILRANYTTRAAPYLAILYLTLALPLAMTDVIKKLRK